MNDDPVIILERLARVLQNDAQSGGLKPTQWEVLRYLDRANRFSRSPGAVTTYLGMTKGTVSQTLMALERKGLIRKSHVSTDRRQVMIEPTDAGHTLLQKDPLMRLEEAINSLGPEEVSVLSTLLGKVLSSSLRLRKGRPFGACNTCRYFGKNHPLGQPNFCQLLEEPLSEADANHICIEQETV